MKAKGTFTQELWDRGYPFYNVIIHHPFVLGLANGSLPKECFAHYLAQDILYIQDDSLALEKLAERTSDTEQQEFFRKLATDGYDIERFLHKDYLPHFNVVEASEKSPAIKAYTEYLLFHVDESSYEIAASALLPCFWVYHEVGKEVIKNTLPNNLYQKWIDTYEGKEYEEYVAHFIEIVEELGQAANAETQEQMILAFKKSTRFELEFFEEAYTKREHRCKQTDREA